MVDAVILWVDGNDPVLHAKRESYLQHAQRSALRKGATAGTRWVDNNELYYCVRLIRRNAPWIARVFLVTDAQRPRWLTVQVATELGVEVVDHTVIFAQEPQCLPTFNSSSIEYALHNIPGLSEQFLYLNDDMFLIRAIQPQEYFDDGVVRPRGIITWKNRTLSSLSTWITGKTAERAGVMRYRGGAAHAMSATRVFRRAHAPYPLLKSRLQWLFPPARVAEFAHYRFRAKEQCNPLDWFFDTGIRGGWVRPGAHDNAYLDPTEMNSRALLAELDCVRATPALKTLCAQSWDEMAPDVRARVVAFMDGLLLD